MRTFRPRNPTQVDESALLLLVMLAASSTAYEVRLSGTVFDQTGHPVLGARVRLAKSGLSTATGPDGRWFLVARMAGQAPESEKLMASRRDDGQPTSGIELSTLERSDLVTILGASHIVPSPVPTTPLPRRDEAGATAPLPSELPSDPIVRTTPINTAPPPAKRRPLQGRELLDWGRPLPPGAFAAKASFIHETWTGTYVDGPVLYGEPSAQDYAIDLRLGLPAFREGAWSDLRLLESFVLRDEDAFDQQGIGSPQLELRLGFSRWLGGTVEVIPPWGSSGIIGTEPSWSVGAGSFVSVSGKWLQLSAEAMYHFGPGFLRVAGEPQFVVTDWAAIYTGASYRRVFHDSRPSYLGTGFYPLDPSKDTYALLSMEPGARLRIGRHTGLEFAVPFTLSGRKTVAHWGLRTGIRGAFGL